MQRQSMLRFLTYFVLVFSFLNITFVSPRYVTHGGIRTNPSNIRAPTGGAVATFLDLAKSSMKSGQNVYQNGMDGFGNNMKALQRRGQLPYKSVKKVGNNVICC